MKLTGLYQTVEAFGWTSNGICGICGQPQRDMQQNYLLQQIKMIKLCEPIKSMQRSHARGTGGGWQLKETSHTLAYTLRHTHCATHTHTQYSSRVSRRRCQLQQLQHLQPTRQRQATKNHSGSCNAVATCHIHTHTVCHTHTHTYTLVAAACVCRLRCQCNAARTPSNCIWLGVLNLKTISHKFNFYFNEQYVPVAAPRCMQHAKSQENTEQASNNRANRATNQLSTN